MIDTYRIGLTLARLVEESLSLWPARRPAALPTLVSVHIPKTAGTTFRVYLRGLYGRRLQCDYGARNPLTGDLVEDHFYCTGGVAAKSSLDEALRSGALGCVHGHFPAAKYYPLVPEASTICWVRDPAERVLSQYHYQRRSLDPSNAINKLVYDGDIDLADYAALESNRNLQARLIDGVPEPAIRFIGVCERFEESLLLLGRLLGLSAPGRRPWKRKVNRKNPGILGPDLRARILELNPRDVELYARATEKLDSSSP